MKKAFEKYEAHLLKTYIENGELERFNNENDKCEVIIDYIVEWFNQNCHLETFEGDDILIVRFGEKYYNKEFDFTHGVIQRVRGIFRKINGDERWDLYLLSDTRPDDSKEWSEATEADKEFIKAIIDSNCAGSFLFELEHLIEGFCFGELETLLNIILDNEDKLTIIKA